MNNYKVEQMINDRGNGAMNQFVIYAAGKHRNIFFRDYANIPDLASKKGIQDALKNGLCNGWTITLA